MEVKVPRSGLQMAMNRSGAGQQARDSRNRLLSAALVAGVTALVFARTLTCGFVDYDDGDYVTTNPVVQAGLTWRGIRWAFVTGHAANWHPLTWLSHMADVACFGLQPAGHHLVSTLLHAANAALLFLLLQQWTGRTRPAFLGALVFAWHPLRVESVAWISERKDVLSLMFGLLTLLAWTRAVRAPAGPVRHRFRNLALLAYAGGLMSKPTLVTLPLAMLLLDYWPFRRTGNGAQPRDVSGTVPGRFFCRSLHGWWPLVREKWPFYVLAAASCVITFVAQKQGGAMASADVLPWEARWANVPVAYARYLLKTLFPLDLAVPYPHPVHWPITAVLGGSMLILGLTLAAWWLRRRHPCLWVGWCWFCGTLVPMLGIVQVGMQSMADRYTYLPSIGLSLALAGLLQHWESRSARTTRGLTVLVGLWLVALGLLTWRQIGFWRNSETLFRRSLAVAPNNELAHNNLGYYYARQQRWHEAIAEYQAALALRPLYPDALNNMGHALTELARPAEALPYLEAAAKLQPRNPAIWNNLGNALADLNRFDEALRAYRRALELDPSHPDTHNNLGVALARQGQWNEALEHLQEAVRLRPNHASSHCNLGNAWAAQGRWAEAEHAYRRALALQPDDARTWNNLGNVLVESGRWSDAEAAYRRSLALDPRNAETHFNLAQLLLRQGRTPEARQHLLEVLRLRPDHPEARSQWERLSTLETNLHPRTAVGPPSQE
jgi:tetratricopeptide (TPR) repeat protein